MSDDLSKLWMYVFIAIKLNKSEYGYIILWITYVYDMVIFYYVS